MSQISIYRYQAPSEARVSSPHSQEASNLAIDYFPASARAPHSTLGRCEVKWPAPSELWASVSPRVIELVADLRGDLQVSG
jgi:hypothetical protein